MAKFFSRFAAWVATKTGQYGSFLLALGVIVAWAASGPFFAFSETWQLVINTGTTIITFLMVFVIQNSQNRDAIAVHVKLDEIIRAIADANNQVIDAEVHDEEELGEMKERVRAMVEKDVE